MEIRNHLFYLVLRGILLRKGVERAIHFSQEKTMIKMKMPKMMSKVRFPILLASRVFFLDDAVTAFNLKPPINHIKEVAE